MNQAISKNPKARGLRARLPLLLAALVGTAVHGQPSDGGSSWFRPPAPTAGPEARGGRTELYFRALEAAARDVPRESFDLAAVAASAGGSPDALLGWVRGHTAWTPYSGSLRGPLGTLMDRRGNSLDRATLLAELLRTTGRTARLAHAELPEDMARKLRAGLAAAGEAGLPMPEDAGRGNIDLLVHRYGEPFGLDAGNLRRVAAELFEREERTAGAMKGRSASQAATIAAMIWPEPAREAAGQAAGEEAAILGALRDHWWVQWRDGETWVDLDPGLDAADAAMRPAPAGTIDWQPRDGRWPLDPKLCHEIELRVIVESWEAGRLSERTVLRQALRPSELFGQTILLKHAPLGWPAELDLAKEAEPAARIKALASTPREWLPVLLVGERAYYEGSFTDWGLVNSRAELAPFTKAAKAAVGSVAQVADVFDTFDAPPTPAPPAVGQLTAEWLEYEIRSPGLPARTLRRQVFDLLGPAARRAAATPEPAFDDEARLERGLSLLGQVELLPLATQLSPAFVDDLRARRALGMREALLALQAAGDGPDTQAAADALAKLPPLPSPLYDLALARHALNPRQADVYLDRPNLLSLHQFLRDDAERGLVFSFGLDIVANEVATRPGLGAEEARRLRFEQGVLDTNAEALVLDGGKLSGSVADQMAGRPSAADWRVLRSPGDAAGLPSDARARIEADLAQGYAVVIPRQPEAAAAWWRIDPKTGQTLGFNGNGWGATLAEYTLVSFIFFDACLAGGKAAGKFETSAGGRKTVIVCALGAIGFGAGAAAGTTAFTIKLLIAAAASGGGAGYGL